MRFRKVWMRYIYQNEVLNGLVLAAFFWIYIEYLSEYITSLFHRGGQSISLGFFFIVIGIWGKMTGVVFSLKKIAASIFAGIYNFLFLIGGIVLVFIGFFFPETTPLHFYDVDQLMYFLLLFLVIPLRLERDSAGKRLNYKSLKAERLGEQRIYKNKVEESKAMRKIIKLYLDVLQEDDEYLITKYHYDFLMAYYYLGYAYLQLYNNGDRKISNLENSIKFNQEFLMEVKAAIIEMDITNKEKLAAMRIHQAKVKRDLALSNEKKGTGKKKKGTGKKHLHREVENKSPACLTKK